MTKTPEKAPSKVLSFRPDLDVYNFLQYLPPLSKSRIINTLIRQHMYKVKDPETILIDLKKKQKFMVKGINELIERIEEIESQMSPEQIENIKQIAFNEVYKEEMIEASK